MKTGDNEILKYLLFSSANAKAHSMNCATHVDSSLSPAANGPF
jgi:hypothetical protein